MPVRNFTPRYKVESPYKETSILGNFMAYYIHRSVNPQDDDILVVIDRERYVERPDLLAMDMYGTPDLWWIFGVRNGFEDPVHDLQMGLTLYVPQTHYVRSLL